MSTLKVTNIQATGETATRAVSGIAAAWAFFDGTGIPSLDGSFNTTSLTDQGTGFFLLTWTSAMSDANYSSSGAGRSVLLTGSAGVQTTTTVRVGTVNSNNNSVDDTNNSVSIHGDLA
jgi:hypothetical protein